MTVQFSPLPRDGSGFVRAISAFDNGKVIFKLKKTDELLEYLKERDFIYFNKWKPHISRLIHRTNICQMY